MQKKSLILSQKGATAVEFAIIFPILVSLIFGIIEFGLFIFNRQVITNAAREGVRAGIVSRPVRLSNDEIKTVIINFAQQHLVTFGDDVLTADDIDINPGFYGEPEDFDPGTSRCLHYQCDLKITVNFLYDFLFLSNLGIGPLNLQATSRMKLE
ncbi:MAG: pilus assembly protein [Sedimentisphaerales bacterium]|nr:pilus assembly protein [Sedimentisphaerales bacterium]